MFPFARTGSHTRTRNIQIWSAASAAASRASTPTTTAGTNFGTGCHICAKSPLTSPIAPSAIIVTAKTPWLRRIPRIDSPSRAIQLSDTHARARCCGFPAGGGQRGLGRLVLPLDGSGPPRTGFQILPSLGAYLDGTPPRRAPRPDLGRSIGMPIVAQQWADIVLVSKDGPGSSGPT